MRGALLLLILFALCPEARAQSPKQSLIPKGTTWFCTERSDLALAHCTRSKEDCDKISELSGPGPHGSTWPACEMKKRAAVYTLHNKLEDHWFPIAQPTFEHCKRSRAGWSREDYDNISDCVAVGDVQ